MRFAFFAVLLLNAAHSWTPYINWGAGYTHYQAAELNRSMQLFAKRASDSAAGFNNFSIEDFNGHPYQFFGLGVEHGHWRISLDADYWVEDFKQSQIPFYTGRDRDPSISSNTRITCEWLRRDGFVPVDNSLTGCIDARESFSFVPLTLGLAYQWEPWSTIYLRTGYHAGIMAGKAGLEIQTDYFEGQGDDDALKVDLDPGINLLQKISLESEYRPWKYFGIGLRAAWRFSQLQKVELKNLQGKSQILSLAFNRNFEEGDLFYIESYRGVGADEQELSITQSKDFVKDSKYYNPIQGDFDGWNLALQFNLYWPQ